MLILFNIDIILEKWKTKNIFDQFTDKVFFLLERKAAFDFLVNQIHK